MSSVDSLRPPTIVIDMIEPDVAPILGGESQAMTDESAHSVPISANQSGIFREFASATMLKMLFHDQSIVKITMKPFVKTHYAAILFADISGFTRLSASLSADKLRSRINNYFSKIINIIQEHCGDVVKFCGDALMIIWPVDKSASAEVQAVTVQMATGCGLHLLHDSAAWNEDLETVPVSSPTQRLGLHCGVAAGLLHCMCLGENDRWEFLVSGSIINDMGVACSEAKNGELFLSEGAYQLVRDRINCVANGRGCYKVDQSAAVFAHIPRHDAKSKLNRTWSSYPELDSASPRVADVAVSRKWSGMNMHDDGSPSSSILTFGSSPLKSPHLKSPGLKEKEKSKGNISDVLSPKRKNSSLGEEIALQKSADALAALRAEFSSALAKEPNRSVLTGRGTASHSALSVTSLSRDLATPVVPRYLSLDDLKAQRQSVTDEDNSNSLLEDNRDFSKGTEGTFSDDAPITRKLSVPNHFEWSPAARSATSLPSSGGRPHPSPKKERSVHKIDEDLEDEQIFMRVEVDSNISSESSKSDSGDAHFFQEPDNEYVLEAKNYLTGYLRREEAESLYEFEGMGQVLRCFVQESARHSVDLGTTYLSAELRPVVTVFIEVIGLEKDFNKGSIRRPQLVLRFMLACLRHFGGGLRQYIVDDKGCVLICGFGLPGFSHNDDGARAVETAVAMKRLLLAAKLECKIGIAQGTIYCGMVGSAERCEYAMMGKSVNLAARMMGKSKNGQITVGEEVYCMTTDKFVYSALPKIRAKGYNKPLAVFCPVERLQMQNGLTDSADEGSGSRKVQEFIGREQEINFFDSTLTTFARYECNSHEEEKLESPFCYVVEGDIGMGKTWLVGEVCYMASEHMEIENILIATAESPQSYSVTQYDTIRQLMLQIFGITTEVSGFDASASTSNNFNAPELQPTNFEMDVSTELSPHDEVARPYKSPKYQTSFSLEDRPNTPPVAQRHLDAVRLLDTGSGSRPNSMNRTNVMLNTAGKSSKVSVASEVNVDISSFLKVLSPLSGGSIRRRHSLVSASNDELASASPFTSKQSPLSRVMEWVDKNVGPDDMLTARVSCSEFSTSTPQQDASPSVESFSSRVQRDRGSSGGVDSFDSNNTGIDDINSASDNFSDRSIDALCTTRPGKVVTRLVFEMLPLLNGLLGVDIPMNDEVSRLSKEDGAIMLNVLLIFIFTRTVEKSKTLLVVEHIQWCDHYSMYIILQSLKIAKSDVFFLGTLRSNSGIKLKSEIRGRRSKYLAELVYCCSHHVLYPFTLDEIKTTLSSALGPVFNLSNPDIVSNHNLSTILDRTDGAPLLVCCLCFEIANAIKEGTFIDIESLPCGRRDDLIDMFDLLGHSDQVILKVASVIGRSFTHQEICYLLVMLRISEFISTLGDALQRMIETGFIEEYHMESKTEADMLGNIDDMHADSLGIGSSPKTQHLRRYRFTNNSVHENVYNLMLEEHREVAHAFLGTYLEPYLAQKPALFDRAVFHFIRSGNNSKKIEYLCKAAEVSRIAGNIRDVYFYFGELVKLSTGLKVQDLLAFCLISLQGPARTIEDMKNSILRRVKVARHMHEFPAYVCLGRRWVAGHDICSSIYSLVDEISVENVCRWIGEMGIILFKLGSLQASANLIKLALHGMGLPVTLTSDIARIQIGKLIPSKGGNMGRPTAEPHSASPSNRRGGVWKSLSSVFSSKTAKTGTIASSLPDNLATLKLAMALFEHLSMINLLHGTSSSTLQYLKYCADIKVKICHILSVSQRHERLSAVSFVDRIIDPEEVYEIEDETKQRYFNTSSLTNLGQALRAIGYRSAGIQRNEPKARLLEAVEERDAESDILAESMQSPSSAGINSCSAYSLSSVSYEQSTPAATPETISTKTGTPNTVGSTPTDYKKKYITRNGQNSTVVFEQAVFLIDRAMFEASTAKFKMCLLCMRRGAVLLGCLSDEVGGTMRQFVHLFQAWCSFVSGHGSKSKVLLEVISKVVSVYEQATLYKWAVELRALKLVLGPSDMANTSAIFELMKQLREILKSDQPTSCSSAIMAMFHACDRNPVEAVKNARFAILKLISRDAVTFVAPLFLFVAGYAAAISMELYATAILSGESVTTSVGPNGISRNLSVDFDLEPSPTRMVGEDWAMEARAKTYKAQRWLEIAEECVSMAQHRLRAVYKTSQPCIVTLYRALKIKHMLCNAALTKTIGKLPFSNLASDVKTAPFTEFSFGQAFLRLEQVNLSAAYHAEKQTGKETALARDADIRELTQMFSSLGCPRYKLQNFGLCRFDSTSGESAGTARTSQSMSSVYSDGSVLRTGSNNFIENNINDLRRVSRLVTQYRPVEVDLHMNKESALR